MEKETIMTVRIAFTEDKRFSGVDNVIPSVLNQGEEWRILMHFDEELVEANTTFSGAIETKEGEEFDFAFRNFTTDSTAETTTVEVYFLASTTGTMSTDFLRKGSIFVNDVQYLEIPYLQVNQNVLTDDSTSADNTEGSEYLNAPDYQLNLGVPSDDPSELTFIIRNQGAKGEDGSVDVDTIVTDAFITSVAEEVSLTVGELEDVHFGDAEGAVPTNRQILVYDSANTRWINDNHNLVDLDDVDTSSLAEGDHLTYDLDSQTWKNAVVEHALSDDSDVNIDTQTAGDILQYVGDESDEGWQNVGGYNADEVDEQISHHTSELPDDILTLSHNEFEIATQADFDSSNIKTVQYVVRENATNYLAIAFSTTGSFERPSATANRTLIFHADSSEVYATGSYTGVGFYPSAEEYRITVFLDADESFTIRDGSGTTTPSITSVATMDSVMGTTGTVYGPDESNAIPSIFENIGVLQVHQNTNEDILTLEIDDDGFKALPVGISTVLNSGELSDLGNVSASSPTDAHVLTWDENSGDSGAWVSSASAGGGGSSDLDGLSDTDIGADPVTGQVLTWTANDKWENQANTDLSAYSTTSATAGIYTSTTDLENDYTNTTDLESSYSTTTDIADTYTTTTDLENDYTNTTDLESSYYDSDEVDEEIANHTTGVLNDDVLLLSHDTLEIETQADFNRSEIKSVQYVVRTNGHNYIQLIFDADDISRPSATQNRKLLFNEEGDSRYASGSYTGVGYYAGDNEYRIAVFLDVDDSLVVLDGTTTTTLTVNSNSTVSDYMTASTLYTASGGDIPTLFENIDIIQAHNSTNGDILALEVDSDGFRAIPAPIADVFGAGELGQIGDVTLEAVESIDTDDVLTWDGDKWINQAVSGGSGGSSTLDGLTDTDLGDSLTQGEVLTVDASGNWANVSSTSGSALSGLSDVDLGDITLASGQHLTYDGSNWINKLDILDPNQTILTAQSGETKPYLVNIFVSSNNIAELQFSPAPITHEIDADSFIDNTVDPPVAKEYDTAIRIGDHLEHQRDGISTLYYAVASSPDGLANIDALIDSTSFILVTDDGLTREKKLSLFLGEKGSTGTVTESGTDYSYTTFTTDSVDYYFVKGLGTDSKGQWWSTTDTSTAIKINLIG